MAEWLFGPRRRRCLRACPEARVGCFAGVSRDYAAISMANGARGPKLLISLAFLSALASAMRLSR